MITVAEYNRIDRLQPLASLWERLWERTPEACFRQSWDWVSALDCGAKRRKLRVLVALLGGRPFGIWPLQVETRMTELGRLRVLTEAGEPLAPFSGPIGRHTTAMLTTSLRHLQKTPRDWDVVDFQAADVSQSRHRRLLNAFRLVGWHCETSESSGWREIVPQSAFCSEDRPHPRFTLEHLRADELSPAPWPFLANCLSLVEDSHGRDAANQLRRIHQAGYRAGITEWCLLRENGVPQAAALFLLSRGRRLCTALAGRTEATRLELLQRLIEEAARHGEEPFWLPSAQIPDSSIPMNATPAGFRYTHISRWALKARWRRLSLRLPNRRLCEETASSYCDGPSGPPPPKLTLYQPSSPEKQKA